MNQLDAIVREGGFEHFGFAQLETPISIDLYDQWIDKGYHGEMKYLARHKSDKRQPNAHFKRAKSAIVITQDYIPHPSPIAEWPLSDSIRIAGYARGKDYHRFLHNKLRALCKKLSEVFPDEEFLSFTDAGPVLERDLAARAGLGWVGKNTCLIDRKRGSLFLLGEIYTSLELPVAKYDREEVARDYCGTCTRCIDACPTGALVSEKELDARKCISYLTIEVRDPAPVELREKMGPWLFGCDICQVVCPWNVRFHGKETLDALHPEQNRAALIEDLRYLLESSNRHLERVFAATPLARVNGMGLKRNALTVAGNQGLHELSDLIQTFFDSPRLGELARWAFGKVSDNKAE